MRIDAKPADLCCLRGPSEMMIRNLAKLVEPFDPDGQVLRASSVLEAAELVAESVPDPYMKKILTCVPSEVSTRAQASVSAESRALVNMGFEAEVEQVMGARMGGACPWAFIMSRGITSVSIDMERMSVPNRSNNVSSLFHIHRISPGDDAWNLWDSCESLWGYSPSLAESLDKNLCSLFSPSSIDYPHKTMTIKVDFFAWSIEVFWL